MWTTRLLGTWARLARGVQRSTERVTRVLAGVAWSAAPAGALTALSVGLGERGFAPSHQRGPLSWEPAWWDAALPPPPARVLVGGAGAGREVTALEARGYRVDAFEPAPALAEALAGACHGQSWTLTHEAVAAGRGPTGPYDAVLLGWGSLSHVLEDSDRRALMRRCAALTDGPILASVFLRDDRRPTRPAALGARLGAALLGAERPLHPGVFFLPAVGFLVGFDPSELEALGREAGRVTELTAAPFPHVTWRRLDP